jgi:hypothetical protein
MGLIFALFLLLAPLAAGIADMWQTDPDFFTKTPTKTPPKAKPALASPPADPVA